MNFATIKKFILKDVRCFAGVQEFDIRPLTFLVGENSTGKSTMLGCMQVLGDSVGQKEFDFDFNIDPYRMGAYIDIARKVGARGGGRSRSFDLGFEIQFYEKTTMDLRITLIERESGSEPVVQKLKLEFDEIQIVFELRKQKGTTDTRRPQVSDNKEPSKSMENGKPVYTYEFYDERDLFLTLRHFMISSSHKEIGEQSKELLESLTNIFSRIYPNEQYFNYGRLLQPYKDILFESFAPIRSKPKRTYDPVKEIEDPEGSGMPMTLMNIYQKDKKTWEERQKKLVEFGKASGLFTDIGIRQHGRSMNDPFQLQIKVNGPKTNITDVGYGVSQILPILVRIFSARRETTFLVQQPEVHLHPKGQAELVSLLINMKDEHKSFIVETHSDAMVNRARIEIMKGKLKPEDVSLIYLEPAGNKVDVHNISFDANANMIGVPDTYRDFFLQEQNKLLGFEE